MFGNNDKQISDILVIMKRHTDILQSYQKNLKDMQNLFEGQQNHMNKIVSIQNKHKELILFIIRNAQLFNSKNSKEFIELMQIVKDMNKIITDGQ